MESERPLVADKARQELLGAVQDTVVVLARDTVGLAADT